MFKLTLVSCLLGPAGALLIDSNWASSVTDASLELEFDPMRGLYRGLTDLKHKIKPGATAEEFERFRDEVLKSGDDVKMFALQVVDMADLVYDLEILDVKTLIPLKRLVYGLLDGTVTVAASASTSFDELRQKIFKDREGSEAIVALMTNKLDEDISTSQELIAYADAVLRDMSLKTETFAVFSNFATARVAVESLPTVRAFRSAQNVVQALTTNARKFHANEKLELRKALRKLRELQPTLKHAFVSAQKVMAIRRLKIARWVYISVGVLLLLLSPLSLFSKQTDIKIYTLVAVVSIGLMSFVAAVLCFHKYEKVLAELRGT